MHFHRTKMEDIINRGGGDVVVELWKANKNEDISDEDISIQIDGVTQTIKGGGMVTLTPGESLTLKPWVYRRFWPAKETALIGIISK